MKRMLLLCLILTSLCAFASADVWVQETWEHWNDTLDCDGVPLIVDADVLILPEGTTGAEYTLQSLSAQETKTIRDTTDWEALGFQADDLVWRVDGSYRCTYGGPTEIGIGPYNNVNIRNEEKRQRSSN